MRHLTNEEIERVYAGVRASQISLGQLDRLCDFSKARISEAVRLRRKLSEEEIARVFSNLKSSQAIEADKGQKMLCTRCKKRLTEPGKRVCPPCSGEAPPASGQPEKASNAGSSEPLHERIGKLENFVLLGAADNMDLFRSFANFERVCRQMRAKCPHLFAAAVRRAEEVAF